MKRTYRKWNCGKAEGQFKKLNSEKEICKCRSLFLLKGEEHKTGDHIGVAPTASGQAALRSDFRNENQSHAPLFLLFREKSRLRMLRVYKCTHNAFAALPTFHGIYGERKRLKIIKSRGVYVAFYSYMRVETACRFVSNAPNATKRNACFAFESEQA